MKLQELLQKFVTLAYRRPRLLSMPVIVAEMQKCFQFMPEKIQFKGDKFYVLPAAEEPNNNKYFLLM